MLVHTNTPKVSEVIEKGLSGCETSVAGCLFLAEREGPWV